eukprot:gene13883-16410_t
MITLDDLRWSRGMLLSRRFSETDALPESQQMLSKAGVPSAGLWGEVGVLVPVLDLLNHHPNAVSTTSVVQCPSSLTTDGMKKKNKGATEPFVVLRNTAPRKIGDEVFNNYGRSGNEALLALYGFAEPDNPQEEHYRRGQLEVLSLALSECADMALLLQLDEEDIDM